MPIGLPDAPTVNARFVFWFSRACTRACAQAYALGYYLIHVIKVVEAVLARVSAASAVFCCMLVGTGDFDA